MAAPLKQDLSTTTQSIQKQIRADNYKMSRTDEIYVFCLMLQREMIGNLNGLTQYLHKDSTANVHNFLTINA